MLSVATCTSHCNLHKDIEAQEATCTIQLPLVKSIAMKAQERIDRMWSLVGWSLREWMLSVRMRGRIPGVATPSSNTCVLFSHCCYNAPNRRVAAEHRLQRRMVSFPQPDSGQILLLMKQLKLHFASPMPWQVRTTSQRWWRSTSGWKLVIFSI